MREEKKTTLCSFSVEDPHHSERKMAKNWYPYCKHASDSDTNHQPRACIFSGFAKATTLREACRGSILSAAGQPISVGCPASLSKISSVCLRPAFSLLIERLAFGRRLSPMAAKNLPFSHPRQSMELLSSSSARRRLYWLIVSVTCLCHDIVHGVAHCALLKLSFGPSIDILKQRVSEHPGTPSSTVAYVRPTR